MNRNISNHVAQLVGIVTIAMLATDFGLKAGVLTIVLVVAVGYDAYTTGWNDAVEEENERA